MNELTEIQRKLALLGYYDARNIDGLYGKHTQTAIDTFKQETSAEDETVNSTLTYIINTMRPEVVDTFTDKLLKMSYAMGYSLEQQAYALATIKHETNSTFKPVEEAYWLSEKSRNAYLSKKAYGIKYAGRGYVQLTWEDNYRMYSKLLNLDLVGNPDLALDEDVSLLIALHGMKHGIFTGVNLDRYINSDKIDYVNARRTVNGTDDAELIAEYAKTYEKALEASSAKYIGGK